jgi:signal peptidase II
MRRAIFVLLAVFVVVADVITKAIILANFRIYEALPVIPGFFQIVHVRNTGAAFGLGANSSSPLVPLLLSVGALAVFLLVVVYSLRSAADDMLLQTGLHLILGGAVGNLIDRFRLGSVVDFLDFYVTWGGREYHWPAFNVADSAIVVGIGILFIDMWRKPATSEERA